MKVINIKQGKTEYDKRLLHLQKTLEFSELIQIIEFCLQNKLYFCHDLLEYWRKTRDKFKPAGSIDKILSLFSSTERSFKFQENTPDLEIDKAPDTHNFVKNYVIEMMECDEELRQYNDSYSWFLPSIYISNFLTELYPEDKINPGMVIAKYLKLLFPEKIPEDHDELIEINPNCVFRRSRPVELM